MKSDHTFDWEGFTFLGKVLFGCMVASGAVYFSLLYATGSHATSVSAPSLVLIQETHSAPTPVFALTLSTTTSERVIRTLTIADAVPPTGKFIAADLSSMILTLYQSGVAIAKYPILAQGAPGSPYETPVGFYIVLTKEPDHYFNSGEQVYLPWSIQFSGNYFIHGWPHDDNGSPVRASYLGGDIRLNTDDAEKVYGFADEGTGIFVYDSIPTTPPSLVLDATAVPPVSAASYLIADIDTGDVLLEENAGDARPITSVTKLMAALVTNETIPFDAKTKNSQTQIHNTPGFVDWMNATAKKLDMSSTHFADASGTSIENVSTPDDLFRLVAYLAHEKSFVIDNTATATDTMVSVISVPINDVVRRVALIVLKSDSSTTDTAALTDWFTKSAQQGAALANTACITCAVPPPYRKIQR